MFNFFKTFIQPVVKAVQTIVKTVQTWIQPVPGSTESSQQPAGTPPPAQLNPGAIITPEERERLHRKQAAAVRQRKLGRMEEEFERDVARKGYLYTESDGERALKLKQAELDNPVFRNMVAMMNLESGLVSGILGASRNLHDGWSTLLGVFGNDMMASKDALDKWNLLLIGNPRILNGDNECNDPVCKAAGTLKRLIIMTEGYPHYDSDNLDRIFREREQFIQEYGFSPEQITWFASDRIVSLEELYAMIIHSEGGSSAASPDMMYLLGSRIFYRSKLAREILGSEFDNPDEIFSHEFGDAAGLLSHYQRYLDGARDAQARAAESLLRNVFSHDDAFIGAFDIGYSDSREPEDQRQNLRNLLQNPKQPSAERFGQITFEVAQSVAQGRFNFVNEQGYPYPDNIFTHANQAIVSQSEIDIINDKLIKLDMDMLRVASTTTLGEYNVFFTSCQHDVWQENWDHFTTWCKSCTTLEKMQRNDLTDHIISLYCS